MANKKKVVSEENIESNTNKETNIPESVKDTIQTNSTSSVDDTLVECAVEKIVEETIENKPTHRTIMISATSKVSTQLNDVWYGFNFAESREILDDSNMELERQSLWDAVNTEVDKQVSDVIYMLEHPQG